MVTRTWFVRRLFSFPPIHDQSEISRDLLPQVFPDLRVRSHERVGKGVDDGGQAGRVLLTISGAASTVIDGKRETVGVGEFLQINPFESLPWKVESGPWVVIDIEPRHETD
jgi:hypothetical protein